MSSPLDRMRFVRAARQGAEVLVDADGHMTTESVTSGLDDPGETNDAANIVDLAQQRSADLLREAAEQAAAIQHEAYWSGREQGERDGQIAARAQLVDALTLVQAAADDAKTVRDRMLANLEREVVELVIDATRTVLGEHARLDTLLVLDTVERALARAGALNVVRIRVHPSQLDVVSASLDERGGEASSRWETSADGTISIGGCIVDTEGGEIDARLDVQLDEIARAMRETLNEGHAPMDLERTSEVGAEERWHAA